MRSGMEGKKSPQWCQEEEKYSKLSGGPAKNIAFSQDFETWIDMHQPDSSDK